MPFKTLKVVVIRQQILSHSKEHKCDSIKVHVEILAEAHAVFENGHVEPLQALEGAMEIKALQLFLVGLAAYVCFQ